MRHHSPLPRLEQIDEASIDSFSLSPGRHQNLPLLPAPTMPIRAFPMLSAPAPKVLAPLQRPQISLRSVTNKHHITAMAPITTIRPPTGHVSLPPKRDAPVPAGPALNPDLRLVVHQLNEV